MFTLKALNHTCLNTIWYWGKLKGQPSQNIFVNPLEGQRKFLILSIGCYPWGYGRKLIYYLFTEGACDILVKEKVYSVPHISMMKISVNIHDPQKIFCSDCHNVLVHSYGQKNIKRNDVDGSSGCSRVICADFIQTLIGS